LEAANQQAAPGTTSKVQEVIKKVTGDMDWGTQNFMLAFFSFTVMVQSSVLCGDGLVPCTGTPAYQVAVGTISGFFALCSGFAHHSGKLTSEKAHEGISAFQFIWWIPGVIVLTFFGSYTDTTFANGYFGSWGAFFFATYSLVSVSPRFNDSLEQLGNSPRRALIFLVVASGIEMGASIGPCNPQSLCYSYRAFAVALGSISLFISLILLLGSSKIPRNVMRYTAFFMILWWVIGTGVVTFGGPFTNTGNGYFASFAAVISSLAFLRSVQTSDM